MDVVGNFGECRMMMLSIKKEGGWLCKCGSCGKFAWILCEERKKKAGL